MRRVTTPAVWVLRSVGAAATLVSLVLFVPWDAAWAYSAPLPATVGEQVEQATSQNGIDGIIVYVDRAAHPPEFYAAGWKDRHAKIPADPHALFKIASISKLYIAVAATQLIAADRLSLDDTLAELQPDLAERIENAGSITLRMLLQHRSGIRNFTDDPKHDWVKPGDSAAMLNLILDDPADSKPGSRHRYSNTNYLLIARILDKTLGYSHRDFIKAEILTPLNLTRTYSLMSEVDPAELMSGYVAGHSGDAKPLDYVTPGGSMIASAEDVGIFLRALNDGSLLSAEEQSIYASVYTFDHTGLLLGYQSIARYHKDIDAVVVLFSSTSGKNSWMKSQAIYHRIVRILRNTKPRKE